MQFKFSAPEQDTSSSSTESAKELCSRAADIPEIVYSWLAPSRQLEFCHGVDDDDEKSLLLIILKEEGKEAGTAWIDEETLRAHYPALELVSGALLPGDSAEEPIADDAWFEKRDRQLKIRWSDELCSNVISREHAINVALSYALAGAGEAYFEISAPDWPSDFAAESISAPARRMISLCSQFNDPRTGFGFGESFIVPEN